MLTEGLSPVTMIGYGGGKSWGNNDQIEDIPGPDVNELVNSLPYSYESLSNTTDYDSATPGEGQAILGDSGGGVFYQDALGNWLLGGIMFAVDTDVEPDLTYIVDLEPYNAQITAIIAENGLVPEPSSVLLLGFALGAASLRRKRRCAKNSRQ